MSDKAAGFPAKQDLVSLFKAAISGKLQTQLSLRDHSEFVDELQYSQGPVSLLTVSLFGHIYRTFNMSLTWEKC